MSYKGIYINEVLGKILAAPVGNIKEESICLPYRGVLVKATYETTGMILHDAALVATKPG